MEIVISFVVAVLAGVICHLICKWLDSNDKDNKYPTGCFASIKEKKNPQTVLQHGLGIRSLSRWTRNFLLPTGIIAYADLKCNILAA